MAAKRLKKDEGHDKEQLAKLHANGVLLLCILDCFYY
jgi:hypothetical protein